MRILLARTLDSRRRNSLRLAVVAGLEGGCELEANYSLSTTILLTLSSVVCAKLRIDHRRAMWITAEMMADIYKHDAYSRRVAQEAIDRYNTHIERCNRAIEAAELGDPIAGKGSEIE